jgi:hypothetical protein
LRKGERCLCGTCNDDARREKVHKEKERIVLPLKRIWNEALLCLHYYSLLWQWVKRLWTNGHPFCTKDKKPYTQIMQLSRLLEYAMTKAGVCWKYSAHSVWHDLVTTLFHVELPDPLVNAYTKINFNLKTIPLQTNLRTALDRKRTNRKNHNEQRWRHCRVDKHSPAWVQTRIVDVDLRS